MQQSLVTSLSAQSHPGRALYQSFHCARGDAENRVKELKCDLFAERSSSNLFDANTVRLYLSSFAHVLYNRLRQALAGTPLSRASPTTPRLRLLKIGAQGEDLCTAHPRCHVRQLPRQDLLCRGVEGSCSDLTWFELRSPVTHKSSGMPGTGSARPGNGKTADPKPHRR